jgi:hypothetical protein
MYREYRRQAEKKIQSMGLPLEVVRTLELFLEQSDYRWKMSRDMSLPLEKRRQARDRAMQNLFFVLDFTVYSMQARASDHAH